MEGGRGHDCGAHGPQGERLCYLPSFLPSSFFFFFFAPAAAPAAGRSAVQPGDHSASRSAARRAPPRPSPSGNYDAGQGRGRVLSERRLSRPGLGAGPEPRVRALQGDQEGERAPLLSLSPCFLQPACACLRVGCPAAFLRPPTIPPPRSLASPHPNPSQNGEACRMPVNAARCPFCPYHVQVCCAVLCCACCTCCARCARCAPRAASPPLFSSCADIQSNQTPCVSQAEYAKMRPTGRCEFQTSNLKTAFRAGMQRGETVVGIAGPSALPAPRPACRPRERRVACRHAHLT